MGERWLPNPSKGKGRNGYPKLCRRDIPIEILERRLNRSRAAIALGDHLIELAPPGGDEGELGSHEKPIQRDQSKYGNNTARRHCYRRRIGGLRSNKSKDHKSVIYSIL